MIEDLSVYFVLKLCELCDNFFNCDVGVLIIEMFDGLLWEGESECEKYKYDFHISCEMNIKLKQLLSKLSKADFMERICIGQNGLALLFLSFC